MVFDPEDSSSLISQLRSYRKSKLPPPKKPKIEKEKQNEKETPQQSTRSTRSLPASSVLVKPEPSKFYVWLQAGGSLI
jgi:hypothetical protein